ncbi:FGGY-family carbohydrate kinase [Lonepinella sp. BR2271]|uniref:FGGY-family carbohydrate kinase n=1 Tax=Lonepinella sp. BR2271 TaxID=3434550 RepID=UPI003F6DE4A5
MNYYLGIDCGGTFIKAALFDQTGKIYAIQRKNIAAINEQAGYVERDMEALWDTCATVIRQTIQESNLDPRHIKALGISAQGKGVFLLDQDNIPLGRAILSSDQRSLDIVTTWQKDGIAQKLYPITHQSLWTGHPVSILRWIKENEPERYSKIGAVLMSHDYLRFRLTGKLNCEETNISESNLYNLHTGQYDIELAKLLEIEEIFNYLPSIVKANEIAGYVTKQAADLSGLMEGTPVVGGLFDVVSTALCSSLDDEQKLNVVLGTWTIVSGVTGHVEHSPKVPLVYGRYINPNQFIIHDDSPTSSGNLEWFIKQFGELSYADINQGISELPPAASSVLFVPFLYGSNIALGMQAGFYGIQAHHTKMHLLQAVYEGVLFSLMYHLERMLQRFPKTHILRVTGGATRSTVWMQMLADLSGLRLEVSNIEETGCLGAALMAMQADGVIEQPDLVSEMQIYHPNPEHYVAYQQKYQRYQKFVDTLKMLL